MRSLHRVALLALSASLLAACGKTETNNADAPLAFAPADTPYAYANLEPLPSALTEQWSRRMQEYLPEMLGMYDPMLDMLAKDGKPESVRIAKVLRVFLDELKTHDNWDKLRQIGFKPDARVAIYGVGLVPVLRLELGDPAAFKAEVAAMEGKIGEKLPVAKIGAQEYWQLGDDKVVCAVAVEGTHLVVTIIPTGATDALKQTLLGLTRPTQNLAAAGTLQTLAKQYGYSNYGEGYFDFVRLTERLSDAPQGTDAEFAKALGLPLAAHTDATCKAEFLDIAHRFPRVVIGANELDAQHASVSAQLEIEAGLAQEIAAAVGAAPGTGAPADGLFDMSLSLPLLKLKDFWMKQADKVGAKPYACAELTGLNESFRQSRQKADVTVPPPASDLTGVRFTLDKIDLSNYALGGVPDMAGKLLLGSSNPGVALAMAQLAVPQLKDLKLTADGKPVALPAGLVPMQLPPMFAAMSDKAVAIALGAGEDAGLSAYLQAPPANDAVFLRVSFSGKLYAALAQSLDRMKATMPAAQQAQWDQQKKVFALYEKWLRRGEFTFTATKTGIVMHEVVEQNP